MRFVHQDPEFAQLVQIVARSTGIAAVDALPGQVGRKLIQEP